MKIVLIGAGASPDRGSEAGITWGWAWHLAQDHDVWLVNYPEFRNEVESAFSPTIQIPGCKSFGCRMIAGSIPGGRIAAPGEYASSSTTCFG
jgi:hypothetical protein